MKQFFIMTNLSKDPEHKATAKIREYLEKHGAYCGAADFVRGGKSEDDAEGYVCKVPENAEICIVLGGDGTMLQAAASVIDRDIPIIGVNLGTLGYLAEVDMADIADAMDKLIAGEFEIEERMMLQGVLRQGEEKDLVHYALNDIVVRATSLQVYNFNIYVNDMPLTHYQADGIILSSPTGSTGYNMSAGGPIVDPKAQILLLTPICPHTINTRTIVLSEHDRVTIEIGMGRGNAVQTLEAAMDGQKRRIMKSGDKIDISAADKVTKIVKLRSESFLNVLREKLV